MGVSRVDFAGKTLVDLTDDTVTPQSLLSGYSAHNRAGESIEGLAVIPTKVSELKNDSKFITETGDSSKTTVTFEQAVKRANVNSGDDLSTAFSKLSKFCEDLSPHAFSAPITNLFATVTGNSLDATMGKNLKDLHDANKNEINALNASLSVETSFFILFGLRWSCIKFGKVVFVNVDGNATEILAANTWSNKVALPFKARYNSTWTGVNSDYSKGLSYIKVESKDNTVLMRSTAEIGSEDRLLRIQFTYICT